MLPVTFWRLVYDQAEIVSALGALSNDVLAISRTHIANLDVNARPDVFAEYRSQSGACPCGRLASVFFTIAEVSRAWLLAEGVAVNRPANVRLVVTLRGKEKHSHLTGTFCEGAIL